MKLPSGTTTDELREKCECDIAAGAAIGPSWCGEVPSTVVRSTDLLALLVAMDLRERLDPDVKICAKYAKGFVQSAEDLRDAADRVLAHQPRLNMAKAPS